MCFLPNPNLVLPLIPLYSSFPFTSCSASHYVLTFYAMYISFHLLIHLHFMFIFSSSFSSSFTPHHTLPFMPFCSHHFCHPSLLFVSIFILLPLIHTILHLIFHSVLSCLRSTSISSHSSNHSTLFLDSALPLPLLSPNSSSPASGRH